MLRTTNKAVKTALNAHILEHFTKDYGWDSDDAVANLKEQMRSFDHLPTAYAGGVEMAQGGTFLVYYAEQREFLENLLQQTEAESNKYSNDKVFKTYVHLIARQIAELVK